MNFLSKNHHHLQSLDRPRFLLLLVRGFGLSLTWQVDGTFGGIWCRRRVPIDWSVLLVPSFSPIRRKSGGSGLLAPHGPVFSNMVVLYCLLYSSYISGEYIVYDCAAF
ncbi:hypothetical protein NE237_004057 [Protea cynaroides]|uniref:Uncharacterized protein n=1 Tax=Protea cynaroides TaxID=273540 RepID=A0A9Q0KHZ0_9MAGN|nr:hypothetical protein NE237_004057 [Protea cynaroides]